MNCWRGAFLYQIYPRSFCDTNNDGIGDLPGITEKLPYIKSLGVDGIWICPFFKSPMKDFGYDVSDYCAIDPMFGTMDDFKILLKSAHDLNLKIIIDLVLSHTSDQHQWFQESRASKNNSKSDWYVWADEIPNNWVSVFGGPAWTFDERRGQYYFHNFLKEQPDLNFHNPEVQDAVLDTAKFWLDMVVDGFRLDVVNFYFHDAALRNNPPRDDGAAATQFEGDDPYSRQYHIYDKSRPENLEFLRRFRALMDQYPDRFTIGEIGDDEPYKLAAQYTHGDEFLNTTYNPQMMAGTRKKLTADLIRAPIEEFLKQGAGWPSWAFSNHDVVRAASRWCAGDGFTHDPRLSKMLIALLGCLYGTVFLYQGEELGLPEARLNYEDLQDPWGKRLWPRWQGRDGCRTPMPWTVERPAKSWLPIPDSHLNLNAADQDKNPESVLNFTRKFMAWRKRQPFLKIGEIQFIETEDDEILAFERTHDNKKILCVFNLSENPKSPTIDGEKIPLPGFGFWIEGFA
jgi:alpha-glucosidase